MYRQSIQFPVKDVALREDVHALGALIGETLRDQGGEEFFEIVFSHDTHSGAKSANATRSLLRAWKRWDFDVPIGMLSVPLISSCV